MTAISVRSRRRSHVIVASYDVNIAIYDQPSRRSLRAISDNSFHLTNIAALANVSKDSRKIVCSCMNGNMFNDCVHYL